MGLGLLGSAVALCPFLCALLLEGKKGEMLMRDFSTLWQAVCFTYAALAADSSYVLAVAQAALSLFRLAAKRIKKNRPRPSQLGGSSLT